MPAVELHLASSRRRVSGVDAHATDRRALLTARALELDDVFFGCAASLLCALPIAAALFG